MSLLARAVAATTAGGISSGARVVAAAVVVGHGLFLSMLGVGDAGAVVFFLRIPADEKIPFNPSSGYVGTLVGRSKVSLVAARAVTEVVHQTSLWARTYHSPKSATACSKLTSGFQPSKLLA